MLLKLFYFLLLVISINMEKKALWVEFHKWVLILRIWRDCTWSVRPFLLIALGVAPILRSLHSCSGNSLNLVPIPFHAQVFQPSYAQASTIVQSSEYKSKARIGIWVVNALFIWISDWYSVNFHWFSDTLTDSNLHWHRNMEYEEWRTRSFKWHSFPKCTIIRS